MGLLSAARILCSRDTVIAEAGIITAGQSSISDHSYLPLPEEIKASGRAAQSTLLGMARLCSGMVQTSHLSLTCRVFLRKLAEDKREIHAVRWVVALHGEC